MDKFYWTVTFNEDEHLIIKLDTEFFACTGL